MTFMRINEYDVRVYALSREQARAFGHALLKANVGLEVHFFQGIRGVAETVRAQRLGPSTGQFCQRSRPAQAAPAHRARMGKPDARTLEVWDYASLSSVHTVHADSWLTGLRGLWMLSHRETKCGARKVSRYPSRHPRAHQPCTTPHTLTLQPWPIGTTASDTVTGRT